MSRPLKPMKEFYTEIEAANSLGISISELHGLLDQHIFNDGNRRPEELSFSEADLVLLGFWSKAKVNNPKVLRMPIRS
jgi:hypothetical protein